MRENKNAILSATQSYVLMKRLRGDELRPSEKAHLMVAVAKLTGSARTIDPTIG